MNSEASCVRLGGLTAAYSNSPRCSIIAADLVEPPDAIRDIHNMANNLL